MHQLMGVRVSELLVHGINPIGWVKWWLIGGVLGWLLGWVLGWRQWQWQLSCTCPFSR
jgi:hypothetical protein